MFYSSPIIISTSFISFIHVNIKWKFLNTLIDWNEILSGSNIHPKKTKLSIKNYYLF